MGEMVGRSLKSQLHEANKRGVAYTLIVGEHVGTVILKSMADGSQRELGTEEALNFLVEQIER